MKKKELLNFLHSYKKEFKEKFDFTIIGIFGSFAKENNRENSDIDILYKIEDINSYLLKYSGWNAINHIVETKEHLQTILKSEIDFVDISSLNSIGKEHILKELIYV
jgi:hypothetical protein